MLNNLRGKKRKKKRGDEIRDEVYGKPKKKAKIKAITCKSRVTPVAFSVHSHSDRLKVYRVSYQQVSDRWEWKCNCPAFIFKKIGATTCKHIEETKHKVCAWKSTKGPEEQVAPGICPRCKGTTEFETEVDE